MKKQGLNIQIILIFLIITIIFVGSTLFFYSLTSGMLHSSVARETELTLASDNPIEEVTLTDNSTEKTVATDNSGAGYNFKERSNFGSITSLAAAFKTIGVNTFNFMLPVFAGFMAYSIAGEEAFLAGFIGGYMTIQTNSGFVGAMIAGLTAGIISGELQTFTNRMPNFVKKTAPIIIFPVFSLILMQAISVFLIKPSAAAIGYLFTNLLDASVDQSRVLAGGLSGMMMATDMGGIINKVAYNYGVNGLLTNNTDIMASVMIGCMVGSGVAGALSILFKCSLPAPHGGIFVFPVMEHRLLYLLALTIGSSVTAILLGLIKKPSSECE